MHLCRIEIFPIKSLDGTMVEESTITSGGILQNDRVYAIMDRNVKVVNGKRTARVHQLRCAFDAAIKEVRLWQNGGSPTQFHLDESIRIGEWMSDFFGFAVILHYDSQRGFPDDRVASGPTITSEASLALVQKWYPELSLENVRRRFRANLELGGGEAFCEDSLFCAPEQLKPFQVGLVNFLGHNPCQRCIVPTRDPERGESIANFQKSFRRLREEYLPSWANAKRFNHFYRFAVNTSIPGAEAGKRLRIGDELRLG
jgi:hypothetical protein